MKVLILGATGFIGSVLLDRLASDGHTVTGLGRHVARARLKRPQAQWLSADLARMRAADDWRQLVESHDVIVNCAGALQDGLNDDVAAMQEAAMLALYEAAKASPVRIVQISAPRISAPLGDAGNDSAFLATKFRADRALATSGVAHVILRPTLVLGRNAHGGSALLRALAALPFAIPLVHAGSRVETVAMSDVAETVSAAVADLLPDGSDLVLGHGAPPTLAELVALHRRWLGLPAARIVSLPASLAAPVGFLADIAGRLGWRSPLRSTALAVMAGGVCAAGSQRAPGPFLSASQSLSANPSGVQDLWFARLYLLKPLMIVGLSIFWLLSGFVPFLAFDDARQHFLRFLSEGPATALTLATCLADIALGIAVLFRPFARRALLGMLALTFGYLAAATLVEPELWADPLGPFVKVLPSILATLVTLAILDER
ncbi:SDR family oxidoreductase [Ensifer adhaerens]|uniref:SDR family oxidoreductase n=1 Tax=Ensifer adhaerens TaxID=106592 RepID=UPI0023A9CAF4|nr:SDR family oxidoreductase [Ensifer adhaerens]WDZ75188.1 SDR family oxidoreductase [Ensifer adhaerens]